MRKLLFAIVVCILAGSVAKADSFTITGPSGTLPVSTSATIDLNASVTTPLGGIFSIVLTVASGPDAGTIISTFFGCGPGLCTFSGPLVLTNDGISGTDVIDGTFTADGLTATTSVTWGGSTTPPTGAPEPGTLSLLAAALAGPLALRRRLAK